MSKKITPKEFQKAREEYDAANEKRKEEIKRLYNEEGWTLEKIADHFGISKAYASRIIRGER